MTYSPVSTPPHAARPRVLIVGAGASGLPIGYHLQLAGAEIDFLVRSGRASRSAAPQLLYSYDDEALHKFDGFTVYDDVTNVAGLRYDFLLITMDGTASRSEDGVAALEALGALVRTSNAVVIMSAFGLGIREFFLETMNIPADRLLHGFLGMLAHQTRAALPVHPPTDATILARATVAYRHPGNRVGFQIDTSNREAARRFISLYNASGVSRCRGLAPRLDEIFCSIGFPVYAAAGLAGWPDFSVLTKDRELWRLACHAQQEIARLPRHGWWGKIVGALMGQAVSARAHTRMERSMRPLDYQAFNRFHHGGKVYEQDLASLRASLADGRAHGRNMPALTQLLRRVDTRQP